MSVARITPETIRSAKSEGRRVPCLTAYDYPTARLLDEAGVPLLLVGDSVGMVVLGFPDTTLVTVDHMVHHTACVARAKPNALVVADLPYQSYESPEQALTTAARLRDAGADAVKLEGGRARKAQLLALKNAGYPVMGHLGMLPQNVRNEGGYRIKGKSPEERERLIEDACFLYELGALAVVIELVTPNVAAEITAAVNMPTIGIGSGERRTPSTCDGSILVTHDLLGLFPWFRPKFVQERHDLATSVRHAASEYMDSVQTNQSPAE